MPSARASRAVNLPLLRSLPNDITGVLRLSRSDLGVCLRRRRSSLASLIIATAPQTTRACLALTCRRQAPSAPSTFACVATTDVACVSRLLRFYLGVRLRRRLSSIASLVVKTASEIIRASLVLACRRHAPCPRRRPSRVSLVATTALLAFPACRVPISAYPPGAVGLRLRRSLSRRRPKLLARLSRSRVVGARIPRR